MPTFLRGDTRYACEYISKKGATFNLENSSLVPRCYERATSIGEQRPSNVRIIENDDVLRLSWERVSADVEWTAIHRSRRTVIAMDDGY